MVRLASRPDGRLIEPRLSGGFAWAPLQRTAVSADLSVLAARATARADRPVRGAGHVVGVAHLLTGHVAQAVAELTSAAQETRDAAIWSDLSAARYLSAVETGSLEDLLSALVATDAALALNPNLPEALFNRALVIERFALRELAAAAWQDYLKVDPASGWATEARQRLVRLEQTPEPFATILERDYQSLIDDSRSAVALARTYPLEVRIWGETEVLARWADATRRGDRAEAARHLKVARALADAIASRGEHLLGRMVNAVETVSDDRAAVLAAAHLDFRAGQRTFRSLKPAEAEELFRRALRDFEAGESPGALLAAYFRANTIYEQGRVEEALAMLDELLNDAPDDSRAYTSQVQWERGLCLGALGRMGESIAALTDSVAGFDALEERSYSAAARQLLANAYDTIGDSETAWLLRAAALPEIGRTNSLRLQSTLGALATSAILRRQWRAASSLLTLELDAARSQSSDVFTTDALLRRSLVRERLGERAKASSDHDAAVAHARRIEDRAVRGQYQGRLDWVGGVIAPSPGAKINLISQAIASLGRERRVLVPGMLFDRARAHYEAGDDESAAADLEEAITELEAHRQSLPRDDKRWGVFHDAQDIIDLAIEIALVRHRVHDAFAYSDRARAAALLDERQGAATTLVGRLAPGHTLVEYSAGPDRLHLFVMDSGGLRHASAAVSRETLAREVAGFHRAMKLGDEREARVFLRRLHGWLMEPLGTFPSGETLVVVPDATLGGVPFSALLDATQRFVIERHRIVVSPSAARFMQTRAPRSSARAHLLTIVTDSVRGWGKLPEAEREARRIERIYESATRLEDGHATPETFERFAAAADVIHFSGHALASEVSAAETFLLLTGEGGEGVPFDIRRIAKLKLERAPLVVLAACSTARGKGTSVEGTLSVAYAFLAAGARDVIATLWAIDDADSASFFERVHLRLAAGETPAEALRASQIDAIRNQEPLSMWAAAQTLGH